VTGMQTARLKAEAQGRKAKVGLFEAERCVHEQNFESYRHGHLTYWYNSLPTHIMSYWSKTLCANIYAGQILIITLVESSRRKISGRWETTPLDV
jgi:hypothetical protein